MFYVYLDYLTITNILVPRLRFLERILMDAYVPHNMSHCRPY